MPHPADFMDIWIRDNVTDWQYTGDVAALARLLTDRCLKEAAAAGITDAMILDEMGIEAFTLIFEAMTHRPEVEFAAQQLERMKITRH